MRIKSLVPLLLLLLFAAAVAAQTFPIDASRSQMTVRVYKAGLFSIFAHDHEIRAPLAAGSITVSPDPGVEFRVATPDMVVLDPQLDQDKRAEVQTTMLGPEVLDAKRYPEIRFRSTRAESRGTGKWMIEGELTIRDQTRPVQVLAEENGDGRYRGSVKIRQKEYGIQPVSLAGGTIKVKDEIQIEFEIARRMQISTSPGGGDSPGPETP